MFQRIASFCRLIFFDRRGTGASDAVPRHSMATWEEWTEDLGAVLDAVGSVEAVLCAELDAGPLAILFAALHPERVGALLLCNTAARWLRDVDYPIRMGSEVIDVLVQTIAASWGTPQFVALANPSLSLDDGRTRLAARLMRASATPHSAAAQYDYFLRNLDVRQALSLIQAPTLVMHTRDNPLVPVELMRYLADHIRGASFMQFPGTNLGIPTTTEWIDSIDEMAEFLTGKRPPIEIDRILTTVLFTDIVGSTARAAALGAPAWRQLLDSHDRVVREQLRRFRGLEIKTTGDGFLASFDGPARAIRCARAITGAVGGLGVEVRAGLHTGECDVRGEDLGGLAVHIASRVGSMAKAGEVLVSGTVKDLVVGSDLEFDDRGEHELKGVPGTWRLFAVRA
jgi:class 3 adenylate cyclase/pimeloyl-ACP methyl ester carboxylesterase